MIAVVHFLGEELDQYIGDYRDSAMSFTAGVSIAYIFVQLLPEFHRIALNSSELVFVFPLLGFSSIHLAEKYIARSGFPRDKMLREYAEVHSAFLFIYHAAVGYLVASLLDTSAVSGLLFFIPIVLHSAVSSLSIKELHDTFGARTSFKLVISSSPLIGVLVFNLGMVTQSFFNLVFGMVVGMFFYVVIRDSIPDGDRSHPSEYLAGVMIYFAVILIANAI